MAAGAAKLKGGRENKVLVQEDCPDGSCDTKESRFRLPVANSGPTPRQQHAQADASPTHSVAFRTRSLVTTSSVNMPLTRLALAVTLAVALLLVSGGHPDCPQPSMTCPDLAVSAADKWGKTS